MPGINFSLLSLLSKPLLILTSILLVICNAQAFAQSGILPAAETVSPAETVPPTRGTVGAVLYVQVQSSKLRQAPQQWAPAVSDVSYGDRLTVLERQAYWLKVRTAEENQDSIAEGFLHSSAVTERKVVLSSSSEVLLNTRVDEQDVYLAGKGFNDEVVTAHAKEEPEANYNGVDAMAKQPRPEGLSLLNFIELGKLKSS